MDPAQLDIFRAVVRHGGMTRAAAALGLGQPHVSRAIARLEAELGFRLFSRAHGSAVPSAEGEAFAREVARNDAGLEALRQAGRTIRELGAGPLRIACQPSLAAGVLPRAVGRLLAERPGLQVAVHVPPPDTIWAWVGTGQCDIGLARPRRGHAGVESLPLLAMDAVCAIPRQHPLARRRVIHVEDLAGVPMIAGGAGDVQQRLEDALAAAGVAPRFALMAQYTAARCGLVAQGLGIAVVDPLPARDLTGLPIVLRPFEPRLAIETRLLRAMGRPPGAAAERLAALLRAEADAVAASMPPSR